MKLNITQEEYIALRKKGLSQEDIVKMSQQADHPAVSSFLDTALNVGSKVTDTLFGFGKVGEAIGTAAARGTLGQTAQRVLAGRDLSPQEEAQVGPGPTAGQIIGSVARGAANFIPGSQATLPARLAAGAATGYAMDVGSKLEKQAPLSEAITPGLGTVVGTSVPALTALTGLVPKALEKTNMRFTPVEMQKLGEKSQKVVDFAAKNKLVGTPAQRLAKVNTIYNEMENKITNHVAKNEGYIPVETINGKLDGILKNYRDDPIALPEVERTVAQIKNFFENRAAKEPYQAIPSSVLNTIKRKVMNRAFKRGEEVVSEAHYAIGDELYNVLEQSVPGLKKMNAEYQPAVLARKILKKAVTRNQAGIFTRAAFATAGGSAGSPFGPGGIAAGGLIGDQIANSAATPIRSTTGAAFQTLADLIDRLPEGKNGTISKNLLLQILQNQRDAESN